MPTAARLTAAICLAALGFIASELIKIIMPASTVFGVFSYVNAALGLLCGWIIVGGRAGRGYSAAISNGFTGMAAMVFWGLFIQGANEMTRLAMRHRYDGPFEALVAIFELMVEYAAIMVNALLISTLLFGAIITGYLTEFAARRWR